jgi:energy-coupling factor transporter ATP-binding protein EcfA2
LNLTTLEFLRPWVTSENHEELLRAVAGKSKCEVQSILAARFPQAGRPSRIRKTTIRPLSEVSFRIEFTASEALCDKLELCRDLMSHANPSRDLAVIIERGLDLLLEQLERKRLGRAKRPRHVADDADGKASGALSAEGSAHRRMPSSVANAVRRKVYERDGVQCAYVSGDGRRCEARAFLEVDHVVAKALGGSNDAGNLRVLCRAHNQLLAEQTFGREWIERCRHFRQQKSTTARDEPMVSDVARQQAPSERQATATIFEKVRSALRNMGFRDSQAREAVATVVRKHGARELLTLEQALRDALAVATAA